MLELKCLILEDEELAANVIANHISNTPGLKLAGICEDVFAAKQLLEKQPVDVLFVDINLPRVSGIDFIKELCRPYHIVLTTAYHQYAIEGYELNIIDYLLKPVTPDRFSKTANKIFAQNQLKRSDTATTAPERDYIFVKSNGIMEKVLFTDILYVEALQNYILIHTQTGRLIVYSTLKNIEIHLPASLFIRVHKSYIVAIGKVDRIDHNRLFINNIAINISKNNKEEVIRRITGR